jgi:hypothetical protein
MPQGFRGWALFAFVQTLLGLVLKLVIKLVENAMIGWGDEKIAAWFGITSPDASTVFDWILPFALAGLILGAYHLWHSRRSAVNFYVLKEPHGEVRENIISQIPRHLYAQVSTARTALGLRVVIAWVLIIGCASGFAVGIVLLATSKQPSLAKADGPYPAAHTPLATTTLPVAQEPPTVPTIIYTERDIRELLDALADANDLVEKTFSPVIYPIVSMAGNWRGTIPNVGVQTFAANLKVMREVLQEQVWRRLSQFVYETHAGYKDQLRAALALDHEAARGELTRSLQVAIDAVERLPDNPTPKTMELVAPQLAEAYKQGELLSNWLSEARSRISAMRENLRTKGRTGYEKT